ncbi:MAG: hypothetical protein ABIU29_05530 [Chthoniobacterales bacterium]
MSAHGMRLLRAQQIVQGNAAGRFIARRAGRRFDQVPRHFANGVASFAEGRLLQHRDATFRERGLRLLTRETAAKQFAFDTGKRLN